MWEDLFEKKKIENKITFLQKIEIIVIDNKWVLGVTQGGE